jgi:hypothetical protein
MFEKTSERNVSRRLSKVQSYYSWLFNNTKYTIACHGQVHINTTQNGKGGSPYVQCGNVKILLLYAVISNDKGKVITVLN